MEKSFIPLTNETPDYHFDHDVKESKPLDSETLSSQVKSEHIKSINDTNYYFDMSGISPENTAATLNSFNERLLLITGSDSVDLSQASYDLLGSVLIHKVKHLILIGQTAGLIELSLMKRLTGKNKGIDIRITRCLTLKQAADCAYLCAKPGENVLLSPAGSMFSGYSSIEELKNSFIECINSEDES